LGRKSRNKREHTAAAETPVAITTAQTPAASNVFAVAVSAALLILVAIIYVQLRTHAFLTFDDPIYVTDNVHVKQGLTAGGIRWASAPWISTGIH